MKSIIYERKDFNILPDFFWKGFNEKNKENILKTGYPIIPILVMICHKDIENESMKEFWNYKENSEISGVFHLEFYAGDFFIAINVNTIEYYITDQLNNWDFKTPYELLHKQKIIQND